MKKIALSRIAHVLLVSGLATFVFAQSSHCTGGHRDASGRYAVDFSKMPDAIASLAKELLEIEATGDRARAEDWFDKYDTMPAELKSTLAAASSVPVDVEPVFSFAREVR